MQSPQKLQPCGLCDHRWTLELPASALVACTAGERLLRAARRMYPLH